MFEIKKTFEISGAHHLNLPYESKCKNPHGHNWIISVYARAGDDVVDKNNGMVVDFSEIKKKIADILDHKDLNEIEGIGFEIVPTDDDSASVIFHSPLNPTAENIARWICFQIPRCYKVEVQESSGNVATYIDDSIQRRL